MVLAAQVEPEELVVQAVLVVLVVLVETLEEFLAQDMYVKPLVVHTIKKSSFVFEAGFFVLSTV